MIIVAQDQVVAAPDPFLGLAPALIGLLGVALGGIIQTVAAYRTERYKILTGMRQDMAELATALLEYASAVLLVVEFVEARRDSTTDPAKGLGLAKDAYATYSKYADDRLELGFACNEKAVKLITASDRHVSSAANAVQVVVGRVITETSLGQDLFGLPKVSRKAAGHFRELNDWAIVLSYMARPRWYERAFAIRSEANARKTLEKLKSRAEESAVKRAKASPTQDR